jgi:hypothetical protein
MGSLALVFACVAVFVSVYLRAGHEVSVLALSRAVPEGATLTAGDLVAVRMSTTSGVDTVLSGDAATVVGQRAAERLQPNTLLSRAELVTRYAPPAGTSVVGVAVKGSQVPASGVAAGETVDVVLTGVPGAPDAVSFSAGVTADGSEIPGTILVSNATVLDVVPSPLSSGADDVDVSLLTPSAIAPMVAGASTAGQIALIIVAPRR